MTDVAVIGAGLAGCTAARHLSEIAEIKVYEKLEHSINEEGLILGCDFIKKRF